MKPFLRILLPAAVCGLLLGACTQRQTTLKFMSYNIRNGRGIDNVQDLGRVAEIINRTAPDIVALQELDSVTGRMAGRFIPGELGEMTACTPVSAAPSTTTAAPTASACCRATNRSPCAASRFRDAKSPAYCSSPSFPTTWSASPTSRLRPRTSARRCPIIRTVTDTCRKPVLLAGDFNMKVAKTVLDGLGGAFRPLSDTTQMTFPSGKPSIRIDYILGRGLPESAVVTERQVDTSTVASDHCPLWVSLAWKK